MKLQDLKSGDVVANCRGKDVIKLRIVHVTKTSVTTEGGARWTLAGAPWGEKRGAQRFFGVGWLETWQPEHEAIAAQTELTAMRNRVGTKVGNAIRHLTKEQCERLLKVVDELKEGVAL